MMNYKIGNMVIIMREWSAWKDKKGIETEWERKEHRKIRSFGGEIILVFALRPVVPDMM